MTPSSPTQGRRNLYGIPEQCPSPSVPQVRRGVTNDDRDEELVAIMGWCPSHAVADAQQHHDCLFEEVTDVDTAMANIVLDEEQDSKGNNGRHADRETLGDTDLPSEEGACREFYSSASRFPFSHSPPLQTNQSQNSGHPLQQEGDVTLLACTPPSRPCNPQAFNFQPSPVLSPTPANYLWNRSTVFSLSRQPCGTEMGLLSMSPPLKL